MVLIMEIRYIVYEEVNAFRQGVIYGEGNTLEECDADAKRQFAEDNYDLSLDYDSIDETGHWEFVREGGMYEDGFVKTEVLASRYNLPDNDFRETEEEQ